MNYNRIILGGRLTRDPELSYTPNNTAVCKFGMAVNRKWKEKDEVMFIDVTAWQAWVAMPCECDCKGEDDA